MRWTPVKHDSRRRPGVQDPRRAPPARQRRLDEARSDARRGAPALYPSGAGSVAQTAAKLVLEVVGDMQAGENEAR